VKYLIYGLDTYQARQFLKSLSNDLVIVESAQVIPDALMRLQQTSLFGTGGLVVFHNVLKSLTDYFERLGMVTQPFVIWEASDAVNLNKIPVPLRTELKIQKFNPLRPQEVAHWIQERAKKLNLNLDYQIVKKLSEMHGSNLQVLENELEKIYLYLYNSPPTSGFSLENLDKISSYSIDENFFQLLDAIGDRNRSKAFTILQNLIERQTVDDWYLFHLLVKQVRQIYQHFGGVSMKIHPYVAEKIARQSKKWSKKEIFKAMESLLEIEWSIKRGDSSDLRSELVSWIGHV
jgi:DNA polymerase III delta subunit